MTDVPSAPSVLVVEDDEDLRELLSGHLRRLGCPVTAVATGEDALDSFRRRAPDVVFVDLLLPGMQGGALIDELRRQPSPRCRIVVTSVLDERDYPVADATLPKPFTRGQVASALAAATAGGRPA